MPVDPTIGLHAGDFSTQTNPFDTMSKMVGVQNALLSNRMTQLTMAARQRAGEIMAASPDLETGLANLTKDPLAGPYAGDYINTMRQANLAFTQQQGQIQTQANDSLTGFLKGIPGIIQNPSDEVWDDLKGATLARTSPYARKQVGDSIDILKKSIFEGLPSDPAQRRKIVSQRIANLAVSAGMNGESFNTLFGTPGKEDIGGGIQPTLQAPSYAGGGEAPAGPGFNKTLGPQVVTGQGPQGEPETKAVGGGGLPGGAYGPNSFNSLTAPPAASTQLPPGNGLGGMEPIPNYKPGSDKMVPIPNHIPGTERYEPANGGVIFQGPNAAQKSSLEGQGTKFAEYKDNLDQRVFIGSRIMTQMGEMVPLLDQARTGGGSETYTKLASMAQAMGAPDSLVNKIQGGSLPAAQEFQKFAVQLATNQLKQYLSTGRITNLEFGTFQDANPNLNLDPRAAQKIFEFLGRVYKIDKTEQDELAKAQSSKNFDPRSWPNKWVNMAEDRGLWSENVPKTTAGRTGKIPPAASGPQNRLPGLPPGTKYSPSRNQYKLPDGTILDQKGNPVQ